MKLFTKNEAIKEMNSLAGDDVPFVFVIDYSGNNIYIQKIDGVDSSKILYDFNGVTNNYKTPSKSSKKVVLESEMLLKSNYNLAFSNVVNNICRGDSYLVNLTCKVPIKINLSMKDIFFYSNAMYKLWIKDKFVCFSPEIFVKIENGKISSYPMKGTIDAGVENAESILINDKKEAAEHATIVDLLRNDLSMVASNVHVEKYRYVDTLTTNNGKILQTSSKIEGELQGDYSKHIGDIIFTLLPAGSITGAPKKRTMEIIAEAEGYDRDFYTGIMGYWMNGKLDSAVMIRFIDKENDNLFFKAGGGITAMSNMDSEYEEVQQKIYVPIY